MNKEALKKIFLGSLTGFLSLALAILLFFCIQRADGLRQSLQWLRGVLMPFVYGGTMAYLLKTPCGFLERQFEKCLPEKYRRWATPLGVVAVLLIAALVLYLLISMVLPEMAASVITLANAVPGKIEQFAKWLLAHLEGNEVLQNYVNNALLSFENWLEDWASSDLLPTVQGMMDGVLTTVNSVVTTVGSVLTVLKNIVLGVIICVYLLAGRKKLARHGKAVVYALLKPATGDKVMEEFRFIDKTFVGFFGGKILDSAIVGLICYAFCAVMTVVAGFQNAVLISVIIGVTNVIPYFGPFIGAVPAALLILINSPRNCLIFLIFILILQQFDGNVLGPKLLAGSVGLTGFWVLFAITLFQGLFGFVGILVGVPVFAVIYDLIRRGVVYGLAKHGKSDMLQE
ncbi:MAG: AI-2E family transporter [Clostridiales bacterium]|nr:AI-2E family transporter [Clostridiales bacterium]